MMTLKRARLAVAGIFLANGFVVGSWAAHIPAVKDRLGLSDGELGLALLAIALAALIAMPTAGRMIARFGSGPTTRVAAVAASVSLPLAALAPSMPLLILGLLYFGATNGALDVSMNAHGTTVEQRLGRAVMSSFHGMFSLGGLIGALLAVPVLGAFGAAVHATIVSVVMIAVLGGAIGFLLPGSADRGTPGEGFRLPKGVALLLGLLTFVALLAEGAILDWGGVYLKTVLDAPTAVAASGFAAFSATMTIGRFAGDRIRERIGAATIVAVGGAMIAGGIGLALVATGLPLALFGFAAAGLGMSNLIPVLFVAAGRADRAHAGENIAAVFTIGYLGLLAGPPVIGLIAEATSLTLSLWLVALLGLTLIAGARTART